MNEEYSNNKPPRRIKQTYKQGLPTPEVDLTPKQIKRVLEKIAADQVTHNESLIAALNTNFDLLTKELTKITADSSDESKVLKTELYENVAALQAKLISTIQANKVELPEELKVKVTNSPPLEKVTFPDTQKVKIINQKEVQKVLLTNPQKPIDIPIGQGDKPGKADPSRYIPVRLTNGNRFYNALAEAYVSASKSVFPFVNYKSGKPQAAVVDDDGTLRVDVEVNVPPVTISGLENVTTISGSKTDVQNFPTVQTVNVQNMPTSVSGTQHIIVDNFPTIQSVAAQIVQRTLTSGVDNVNVSNFPTVQTVAIQSQPTLASGIDNVNIANFPTIQGVSVKDMPQVNVDIKFDDITLAVSGMVTTISGSKTDVQNFPTVQTVNVQNQPTLASGIDNVTIANFPTIQTVSVKDMPTVTAQLAADGITTAVSGTVTTISGSKTDIQNFPTIQTVNVQNLTTISGQQNFHVDNFPTVQTVNVQNQRTLASGVDNVGISNFPTVQSVSVKDMPTVTAQLAADGVTTAVSGIVTTISGSKTDVQNFPTIQTVNVQNLTTISGQQNFHVDNFPTVQKVSVQDLPNVTAQLIADGVTMAVSGNVTTISGSKTDIQNFPTIQTVNVQNLTTISGQQNFHVDNWPTFQSVNVATIVPLTSLSGMFHSVVDNFPTVQKVSIQDMPTVTAQLTPNGTTMAVSGTVTTISGSQTDIKNWPTYQTVNVANIVPLTSISGMLHAVVDNFPTMQNIGNLPLVTISGQQTMFATVDNSSTPVAPFTVNITTAATQIVAANAGRRQVIISNDNNTTVYIGFTTLTTSGNGVPLYGGEKYIEDVYKGAIYGIVGTTAVNIRVQDAIV